MLTLTLFRHAKSSWDFPELDDFDRPLAKRGQKAAPQMADFLAERDLVPDHVICSAALRTRETLELVLAQWTTQPTADYAKALYETGVETLLSIAHDAPSAARHVMIVGHNPGLEDFAAHMIGGGDRKARHALASKFPTAALAVITFDVEKWADIQPGKGTLDLFATPKQLEA